MAKRLVCPELVVRYLGLLVENQSFLEAQNPATGNHIVVLHKGTIIGISMENKNKYISSYTSLFHNIMTLQ